VEQGLWEEEVVKRMVEYDEVIKNIGYKNKPEQEEYYKRTINFLKSNEYILMINPGGMGLGKTLATSIAILNSKHNYSNILVATPFSNIKDVWAKEMNKIGLNKDYITWLSRDSICKKNIKKRKDCNDSCEFRCQLEENQEYTQLCDFLLDELIQPMNDYKELYDEHCLLPIIRNGGQIRDIIIGDYFLYLFNTVYKYLVKKSRSNCLLCIDEAHLLKERAESLLSKTLRFRKTLEEIKSECFVNEYRENSLFWNSYDALYNVFKVIKKEMNIENKKNKFNIELELKYNKFKEIYNSFDVKKIKYDFDIFIDELNTISKIHLNDDPIDETDNSYTYKFIKFIRYWEDNSSNETFNTYIEYIIRKDEEILLKIDNIDCSEYLLKNVWKQWKKIILLSGTINVDKTYLESVGIKNLPIKINNKIESYSLRKDILIYGVDVFKNNMRLLTYNNNKNKLNELLKILKGRTLIYCITKNCCSVIEKQLKYFNYKVINIAEKLDESLSSQAEKIKRINEFNNTENSIGLMCIRSGVEGENFTDDEGFSVNNIIIYGFPFINRGLKYRKKKEYYLNKYNNNELVVNNILEYNPVSTRVLQACARAKRSEKDKPIIILWDRCYASKYNILLDDLKGEIIYNFEELKKRCNDANKE
jgi:Rad3-related DNA helicase